MPSKNPVKPTHKISPQTPPKSPLNHQPRSTTKLRNPVKLCDLIRLRYFAVAFIFAIASCSFNFFSPSAFAQASSCDDVRFIFARGSGEALGGPSMSAWHDEIADAIGEVSSGFKYSFYELGSQPQSGHQYPAVAVSDSFEGYVNLVGAYFSSGEAFRFGASVEEGIKELRAYISRVSDFCPNTKFVLGGYSQGAMVLSAALPAFNADKIIYVSTFGDPKLYLPEGKSTYFGAIPKTPDACRGLNLSPYRISVPDCRAYEGILGSYRPYQPDDYQGKLGTWCNEKDIMCSSGASISDHTSYASSNLYRDAAAVIAKKLAFAFPKHDAWSEVPKIAKHNVAFIIDTTYSMDGVIDQYRAEAKKLAAKVKADGGNIALIQYRDLRHDFAPQEMCNFSCTLNHFNTAIDGLTVSGGGRDVPESALSAMLYAMNRLQWQAGATKSIVLLTDAEYHNPDYDGTTFSDVVQRSLEIDPVNIFPIVPSHRGVDYFYQKLANATSGQVLTLGRVDLSAMTNAIYDRPVARLTLSEYAAQVGEELLFDSSSSYAPDSQLTFDWDLDGDGTFELADVGPILHHIYRQVSNHHIQVRITDQTGRFSTMSAHVVISNQPLTLTTVSELKASPQSDNAVVVSFRSDGNKALLTTDNLVRGFVEIKDGAGSFTLQDTPTEEDLTITLTPYSISDERGISSSLTISISDLTNPTNPPTNPNPAAPSEGAEPGVPTLPNIPKPPIKTRPAVSKAPNTGLISRQYR